MTDASSTGQAPVLRDATPDDVAAVVAVATAAYRATGPDAGWTSEGHLLGGERTNPTEVLDAITAAATRVLVSTVDDVVVGVIKVQQVPPDGAHFGLFAVDPRRQSGGTGSRLLDEAERIAAEEWGAAWMELEVIHQRTDLQDWYRRRGYVGTGDTRPFPYQDQRFGLPRRDDLVFDVFRRPLGRSPRGH